MAPLSYRIWESNVPFKIAQTTGLLSQNGAFNYESETYYLFHVVAEATYDGVTYTAVTSVFVKIEDINDNEPVFKGALNVSIPENILVGEHFFTVTATDGDAPGTSNSLVQYSIRGSNKFAINPNTGVLSVIQSLDYESQQEYQVTVTAFDKGAPVQSAEQAYTIFVLDSNDNRPKFPSQNYRVSIREDASIQTEITCINATDADRGENAKIEYNLVSAEEGFANIFSVSASGCIYYIGGTGDLDRETKSSYEFILKATDKGSPSLTGYTNVIIDISDVNDNNPLFANSLYNLQLSDKTPSGTNVIRLVANDLDAGLNGVITYTITDGNLGNSFRLLSNGQLQTATTLDLNSTPDKFSLTIRAEDRAPALDRRFSTATVNIDVIESNIFINPVFDKPSYTVNITEAQVTGVTILTVQATLPNIVISYELLDCSVKTAGKLQINANGQISLLQQLNYEELHVVSFYVKAYDATQPNNGYSIAQVKIYISDVNDERPVFQRTIYQTSLARDSKSGTVIANVVATDADSGNNGLVRYEFEANSLHTDIFGVNTITGDITLKRSLSKADIRNFEMKVRAYDLGSPRQTSSSAATININVYPDNMFKPVITNPQALIAVSIPETEPVNNVVVTVQARDEDVV